MKRVSDIIIGDLAMLMALGFVSMVIFMLPWLNPPTEADTTTPPGNLIFTATWPAADEDVDLWVMGPTEIRPVGYSNQSGELLNLLRDDLGRPDTDLNFENAFSRGAPDGEYIVNVHCYRCSKPVTVSVDVKLKGNSSSYAIPIAKTKITLRKMGDERTAIRFMMKDGSFIRDSLHNIYKSLRSWHT
jgi:hypothetical protein